MRIEALSTLVAVVWLTAVLCPRLIAANNLTLSSLSPKEHFVKRQISDPEAELLVEPYKRLTYREMQMILREEGGEDSRPVDCCPEVKEMVQPTGGRDQKDTYVDLYRDGENVQLFYEYSCRPDVLNKPCRFVDRKFSDQSRCVQKYSFVYAIVENKTTEHGRHHHREHYRFPTFPNNNASDDSVWRLDYIKVRSGCICQIMPMPKPKPKKKKIAATKARRTKSKQRQPRHQESDSET